MKNICLCCGEWKSSTRPLYCSQKCGEKIFRRRPLEIKKDFKIFQNIAYASDNYEEFASLYKNYFGGD